MSRKNSNLSVVSAYASPMPYLQITETYPCEPLADWDLLTADHPLRVFLVCNKYDDFRRKFAVILFVFVVFGGAQPTNFNVLPRNM